MIATLAIFTLALGGIGGSLQPTRLLILLSGIFFEFRRKTKKNLIGLSPVIKKGLIVYLIWIIYGLLSLAWSPDPIVGLNSEIIVMAIGMSSLLFFPYYYQNNPKTVDTLCRVWALSCILTLPIAVYEIFTFNHFFYDDDERILGGLGINAPFAAVFFGNYNGYSTALCFYYPFLLIAFLNEKQKITKILYSIAVILTILVVIINTSRGAIVAIGIISFIGMKINIKRIVIFFFFTIGLYFIIPSSLQNTIDTVIKYRFIDAGGMKDTARSDLLSGGIDFVQNSYGFGIGAGGFEKAMEKSVHFSGMINPHNLYLEVASQYGIFVFVLFIYWIFVLVYNIWKSKVLISSTKRILLATILSTPIIGVIHSAALGYTYWWVFFTTIALIASVKPKILNNSINK